MDKTEGMTAQTFQASTTSERGASARASRFAMLGWCLLMLLMPIAGSADESPPAQRGSWNVTPDLQVQALEPGIWIHVSWQTLSSGVRFPSNGLIVQEDDSVLLVDTAWGEESTEALLGWIDRELGLPVSAVIATHAHADRMGGGPVLKQHGIPMYAHPLGFAMAAEQGWEPLSIGALKPGEALPFQSVEIFYPGPAHTVDNIMVWLPRARLLVGGCAVKSISSRGMGNVADADVPIWPSSIELAGQQYPEAEWVLPGHGDIGGQELLLHTNMLLEQANE